MKYVCRICGYIYDEEKMGKKFSDLPDDWECPICGAQKSQFEALEEKAQPEQFKKYVCRICGYIYDEEKMGKKFSELPDDWECPICGAQKSQFEEIKSQSEKTKMANGGKVRNSQTAGDDYKLSVGQLAALCSNLARGCEKQYKEEQSRLFAQLADYFTSVAPAVNDASVEKLCAMLEGDAQNYAHVRSVADENADRGAARVCVWGEKVTRMLSSLVGRYLKEGEKMLADTQIWVCSVCGFTYIGDNPPELCPVCKVPSWKFDKIEGRAKK